MDRGERPWRRAIRIRSSSGGMSGGESSCGRLRRRPGVDIEGRPGPAVWPGRGPGEAGGDREGAVARPRGSRREGPAMLSLPSAVRIFLCTEPTDMRRGFDRLAEMGRPVIRQDPVCGHLFVFRSRRGDRLKLLYWDTGGFAMWYKRLEKGRFHMP